MGVGEEAADSAGLLCCEFSCVPLSDNAPHLHFVGNLGGIMSLGRLGIGVLQRIRRRLSTLFFSDGRLQTPLFTEARPDRPHVVSAVRRDLFLDAGVGFGGGFTKDVSRVPVVDGLDE